MNLAKQPSKHQPTSIPKQINPNTTMSTSEFPSSDPMLSETKHNFLHLTLNRPAVYNAITPDTYNQFSNYLKQVNQDPSLIGLVITGNGKFFSSGFDLKKAVEFSREESTRLFREFEIFFFVLLIIKVCSGFD